MLKFYRAIVAHSRFGGSTKTTGVHSTVAACLAELDRYASRAGKKLPQWETITIEKVPALNADVAWSIFYHTEINEDYFPTDYKSTSFPLTAPLAGQKENFSGLLEKISFKK